MVFFSPNYAKRTSWPRADCSVLLGDVQRLRLRFSKETWIGLVPASELADQNGNQTRKCHSRSPLQLIFHDFFVSLKSYLHVLPFQRGLSSTASRKTLITDLRNLKLLLFNFFNYSRRKFIFHSLCSLHSPLSLLCSCCTTATFHLHKEIFLWFKSHIKILSTEI